MALDPKLRYPNEQPLFVLGVALSALAWLALAVSIVGIFYGLIGLLFTLVAHALFLANVKGNGVRVSPQQFPELYERCKQVAQTLGLAPMPEVYIIQAGGALNAFATKLLNRRFVIIYSHLADDCQDPRQLDFVVGHEMGHLAAGHLTWNAFLWPFMLLPWLGAAYLRAREYTSDRCGYSVVGDVESAMRGLIVLAAGGKHAAQADVGAFMDQRRETGQFWSAVLELVSSHPYLCKRVAALQELHQPGSAAPVGRNILAYPLAPILGLAAAGPAGGGASLLVVVAVIGIIAAIAIPSLLRARVSANEAATIGEIRTFLAAQASYAKANQGYFDSRDECLVAPARCIPGYSGASLLTAPLTKLPQHGYTFTVSPGQRFAPGKAPPNLSPSSTNGYAIVAHPLQLGQTGVRTFCGDSSGSICFTTGVAPQNVVEVLRAEPWIRCSSQCNPLR
jgi:Zn-dependent protease with chaperone function/type II secretory pathway pseudopilin PulG